MAAFKWSEQLRLITNSVPVKHTLAMLQSSQKKALQNNLPLMAQCICPNISSSKKEVYCELLCFTLHFGFKKLS